jgi:hypothetical protein
MPRFKGKRVQGSRETVRNGSQEAEFHQSGGAVYVPLSTPDVASLSKSNRQTPQVESLQLAENKTRKVF